MRVIELLVIIEKGNDILVGCEIRYIDEAVYDLFSSYGIENEEAAERALESLEESLDEIPEDN